jgi:biotin transport system substrate-specific component
MTDIKAVGDKKAVRRISVYEITRIAVFVALISVSGYIAFPLPFTPVLVTAQTLVLMLAALVLKPKQMLATVAIYILLGTIGLPVFSGGRGGLSILVGPTGGFIIAFLVAAPLVSYLKGDKLWRYLLVTLFVGTPLILLGGTIYYSITTGSSILSGLMVCVVPFIIGDVLKAIAASIIAISTNKALEKIDNRLGTTKE